MKNADNSLLVKLAKEGNDEAKNTLVETNAPLSKSVIKRDKNKGVEDEDL